MELFLSDTSAINLLRFCYLTLYFYLLVPQEGIWDVYLCRVRLTQEWFWHNAPVPRGSYVSSSLAPGRAVVLLEVLCSLASNALLGLVREPPSSRKLSGCRPSRKEPAALSPSFFRQAFLRFSAHVEDFICVRSWQTSGGGLTTLLNMQQVASYCFRCSVIPITKLPPLETFPFNVSAHDLMERFVTFWICPRGENYCRLEGIKLLSRRVCIDCCSVGWWYRFGINDVSFFSEAKYLSFSMGSS